jgi:16S rRNA (uracil1498-N3)-methyltransferase
MSAPFFYISSYQPGQQYVVLDESNSKHAIQVLRLQAGDRVMLTDGLGRKLQGRITDHHRKACQVQVESEHYIAPVKSPVVLAVSLLKNTSRLEWLLEKVTELGVSRIIPLICQRTEKESLRTERMQAVLISAMLQSQQSWLPVLDKPHSFSQLEGLKKWGSNHCIAYCGPVDKMSLANWNRPMGSTLVCIGPEGDFTEAEHAQAIQQGFTTVSLGENRLRTETAAMVAVTLLCQGNGPS